MTGESMNALTNVSPNYQQQLAWGPDAMKDLGQRRWNDQTNHIYVAPIVHVIPGLTRFGILWDLARPLGLSGRS